MEISAFKISGIEVSWGDNHVQVTNGDPNYEDLYLTKEIMSQIAIQWLLLHNPEVVIEDSD